MRIFFNNSMEQIAKRNIETYFSKTVIGGWRKRGGVFYGIHSCLVKGAVT